MAGPLADPHLTSVRNKEPVLVGRGGPSFHKHDGSWTPGCRSLTHLSREAGPSPFIPAQPCTGQGATQGGPGLQSLPRTSLQEEPGLSLHRQRLRPRCPEPGSLTKHRDRAFQHQSLGSPQPRAPSRDRHKRTRCRGPPRSRNPRPGELTQSPKSSINLR